MDIKKLIQLYDQHETSMLLPEQRTNLMSPIKYIMGLKSKRIRPLLVLVGYACYKEDVEKSLNAAFGLEVFHNFTLMHDDIMDEAELRRGQQAAHLKYGINEAIISGDAMSIIAYQYLIKDCSNENLRIILSIFNKTSLDICVGQQMDMEFEKIPQIKSSQYIEMIRLKTAVFLGMALQVGSIIAGADEKESQALYDYGQNLGIAFQIQDDLLDLTGDQEKVGKMIGGDIIRNKKTLLICKAHELCNSSQQKELEALMIGKSLEISDKLGKIIRIFKDINLFKVVQNEIDGYFEKANQDLTKLNLHDTKSQMLQNISKMIQDRKS